MFFFCFCFFLLPLPSLFWLTALAAGFLLGFLLPSYFLFTALRLHDVFFGHFLFRLVFWLCFPLPSLVPSFLMRSLCCWQGRRIPVIATCCGNLQDELLQDTTEGQALRDLWRSGVPNARPLDQSWIICTDVHIVCTDVHIVCTSVLEHFGTGLGETGEDQCVCTEFDMTCAQYHWFVWHLSLLNQASLIVFETS